LVLQPALGQGETRQLEGIARRRGDQHTRPDHAVLLNRPYRDTSKATMSKGTPAGTNGSTAIATTAAASAIASGPRARSRDSRSPYIALREPSSAAVAAPAHTLPPAPITPTRANWEAPVNMRTDKAHVWSSGSPAAVEIAPKEIA